MPAMHSVTRSCTRYGATLVAALGAIVVGALLAACSTTEGFGKDVKNLGGGIENSAAKNK